MFFLLEFSRWHMGTCFLVGNRFPYLSMAGIVQVSQTHSFVQPRWHGLWVTRPGWPTLNFSVTFHCDSLQLQTMRHDFKNSLHGSAAALQSVEKDPVKGDVTTPHSTSPPRVLCSYQQHVTDHVCLIMEEGVILALCEDQAIPLMVEVSISLLLTSFCFLAHLLYNLCLMSYTI